MARRDHPVPPSRPATVLRPRFGALAAALAAITLVAYAPVLTAGFVQDDHVAVEDNPIVARGDVGEILTTDYWAGARGQDRSLYRPTTVASFALERRLVGRPEATISHVVNLVLHVLASLALLALARRLDLGILGAGAAALVFAVHPVHVEAVGGIVGRAEILAALFALLAVLAYARTGRWRGSPEPTAGRRRLAAWTAAGCVLLALGSKETAVVAPILLPLADLLFRPPERGSLRPWLRGRVAAIAPSVLAGLVYLALRAHALGTLVQPQRPHPVDNPLVSLGALERLPTALGLLERYVALLFVPLKLSADYSGPVIAIEPGMLAWRPLVGLAILAALALAVALPLARRRGEPTAFGAVWFLLPYLVVGNLLFPVGAIFAERFLYLPSVGFCLLLGVAFRALAERYPAFPSWSSDRRLRFVGLIVVLIVAAFAFRTWERAGVWQSDATVFAAAAAAYPSSPRANFILGSLAAEHGDADEALARYDRALAAEPAYVPAWFERGVLLARLGRLDEAVASLRETIRRSPEYALAHFDLGIALRRQGKLDEAETALRQAVVHDPDLAKGWAELGNVAAARGRAADAADAWRRAIALGRTDLVPRLEQLGAREEGPR